MRRTLTPIATALVLVLAAGCDSPVDQEVDEVAEARALWASFEPDHYEYTLERHCFCAGRKIRIEVENGGIVSVRLDDGRPEGGLMPEPLTMDQIFDLIELLEAEEPDVFEVRFDRWRGFPTDLLTDDNGAVDASFHLMVRDFAEIH